MDYPFILSFIPPGVQPPIPLGPVSAISGYCFWMSVWRIILVDWSSFGGLGWGSRGILFGLYIFFIGA